jgi:adenylate cyclase class IV
MTIAKIRWDYKTPANLMLLDALFDDLGSAEVKANQKEETEIQKNAQDLAKKYVIKELSLGGKSYTMGDIIMLASAYYDGYLAALNVNR